MIKTLILMLFVLSITACEKVDKDVPTPCEHNPSTVPNTEEILNEGE